MRRLSVLLGMTAGWRRWKRRCKTTAAEHRTHPGGYRKKKKRTEPEPSGGLLRSSRDAKFATSLPGLLFEEGNAGCRGDEAEEEEMKRSIDASKRRAKLAKVVGSA